MRWQNIFWAIAFGCLVLGCKTRPTFMDSHEETQESQAPQTLKEENPQTAPSPNATAQQTQTNQTAPKTSDYPFPKPETIISIDYIKQGNLAWTPVPKELWPAIADCFVGNKRHQRPSLSKPDLYVSTPPFSYHLRIKYSVKYIDLGQTLMVSVYGGEELFTPNASLLPVPYFRFTENQGTRLREMIESATQSTANGYPSPGSIYAR